MESICSTKIAYHYLFNDTPEVIDSIKNNGLQPLSNFPNSKGWQQINDAFPDFFEKLYGKFAKPVIQKPYLNSGVFLTPIDFKLLPDSIVSNKGRLEIPIAKIDPEWAVITYVYNDKRVSLTFSKENLENSSKLWNKQLVERWFGVNKERLFFYVPQIVTYQPGGVKV